MILLLRHTAVRVAPGVCYGRSDMALAETAEADMALVLAQMPALVAPRVVSSPALRCVALARALGHPFTIDARLLELDFGAWEGLPWAEVPRAALDEWAADPWGFAPPGGESGAALLARIQDFWRDFSARLSRDATTPLRRETATQLRRDAHQQPLVLISHGGPLRLLRQLAEGRAPDILEKPPALGAVLRFG